MIASKNSHYIFIGLLWFYGIGMTVVLVIGIQLCHHEKFFMATHTGKLNKFGTPGLTVRALGEIDFVNHYWKQLI